MEKNTKHYSYCFTLNNYTSEDIDKLNEYPCTYLCYGKEIAPKTGTPHLQGYVHFMSQRYFNSVRTDFKWNIQPTKGDSLHNLEYCRKEGTEFYERGIRPISKREQGVNEKRRWEEAFESAKQGKMEEIPVDMYTRYYNTYNRISEDNSTVDTLELGTVVGEWIYGPPGVGKSTFVHRKYPSAYRKNISKWWDNYKGQREVIIEDVGQAHRDFISEYIKQWVDIFPFNAERKGGTRLIRPLKIIITSNFSIEQLVSLDIDQQAIKRRFIETYVDSKLY